MTRPPTDPPTRLPVVSDAAPNANPCEGCIAGCCRGFSLPIQGWDIYRIWRDLEEPVSLFAELRWVEEPEADYRIRLSARATERRHYRLVLLRVDEEVVPFHRRCFFLEPGGTRGRCTAYHSRPTMCRVYPATLDAAEVSVADGRFCATGSWSLAAIDVPSHRSLLLFQRRQRVLHDRVVDAWNARVLASEQAKAAEEFYDFVIDVYRQLERAQPGWFEAPRVTPDPISDEELHRGVERVLGPSGASAT
jgi:Fe-S-cluster containining protein